MKVKSCLYCGDKKLTYVTHRSDDNGILRCERCSVLMVENISDDTEQLYTADYFEKQTATKNGYTNYLSSPAGNLIGKYAFSRLFARQGGVHLDLGCADGSLMEIFVSEGFESHGLEISKDAVKIANTKGLNVQFSALHGFPANLPKSNVITAFDLLEHADKPGVVLREVYKNLADDGYFVFSTLSVKKNNPTDYWFNNSLEHYIYYNRENLTYILTDVFGEGNFAFVEEDVNGIAEFWGFAKRGTVTDEQAIIEQIESGETPSVDADTAYLMSLFFNQVSKFQISREIIERFGATWPAPMAVQATFFNHYFQGQLDAALKSSKEMKHLVPVTAAVYWQALSHAEEEFAKIRQNDIVKEYNAEVLSLRDQLFQARDELHALKNSRVVGRVIKIRDIVGDNRQNVRHIPKKALHKVRVVGAPFVPGTMRRAIKNTYKSVRQQAVTMQEVSVTYEAVENTSWQAGSPLVSVVIPYYNSGATLEETLDSLDAQTFADFEVIIVNDGSTEASSQKKLDVIASERKVTIINQENQGVAVARNAGIAKAKGKYVICLDSDDMLEPTYIEKSVVVLETDPDVSLITAHQDMFGVQHELFKKKPYDPLLLFEDNMVITAAAFRKEAWAVTGGYKSKIGYEDWEFWLNLAEHGFWGKLIPESLFKYRTSLRSRYVEDKDIHWNNIKAIRELHPKYHGTIKRLLAERRPVRHVIEPATAFVNVAEVKKFNKQASAKPNVLITIPWMVFGGAETLIYNYCREIQDKYNLSFVTGLKAEHEWEYKFKEITPRIYHLANLFEDERLYLEFISNYISTRNISVLHIIHNGFTFSMLAELKKRHPELKVVVTLFNDRVEYFEQSIEHQADIDVFTSDNAKVATHFKSELASGKETVVIPNGINCFDEYNPELFDVAKERKALGLKDELAVIFVGRLSEEKNPDVFVKVAKKILDENKTAKTRFYVIGDGPMRNEIEKAIKDIGDDRITYLGYQAAPARYFAAADVFVLPSAIEGFPLSILEAMAMKSVVIASDVGAVAQVVGAGKDGFVVTPGSVDEIVAAINKLQKNPRLLERIKESARKTVEEKYSNIALGKNYSELYRKMSRESKHGRTSKARIYDESGK